MSKIELKNNKGSLIIEHKTDAESRNIKSDSLIETVATIDDMLSIKNTFDGFTTIVTDSLRGGVFVYDSKEKYSNDGGVVFNGWVRQYNDYVFPEWFGANGDGVTDDSLPLKNMFLTEYKNYMLNQTYLISEELSLVDKSHITIEGKGTLKLPTTDSYKNTSLLTFKKCDNIKISGLHFIGNGKSNGVDVVDDNENQQHLLKFGGGVTEEEVENNKCYNIYVSNIRVEESTKFSLSMEYCVSCIIKDSVFVDADKAGISLWSCDRVKIINNECMRFNDHVNDNSYGISCSHNKLVTPCTNIVIDDNYIYDTKWEGIDFHNGENITITNNIIKNPTSGTSKRNAGIAIVTNGVVPLFKNVIIKNNHIYSTLENELGQGITIYGSSADNRSLSVILEGNIITNMKDGLRLHSTNEILVKNSIFKENNRSGIYITHCSDCVLEANIFNDNGKDSENYTEDYRVGIYTYDSEGIITDNYFKADNSYQVYGISISDDSNEYIINNNYSSIEECLKCNASTIVYNGSRTGLPTAFVNFTENDDESITINNALNISDVTKVDDGEYNVHFNKEMLTDKYITVTDVRAGSSYSRIYSQTTEYVRVKVNDGSAAEFFTVLVFGGQIV